MCYAMQDCVAFDYDPQDPPHKRANCWIHDKPNIIMKQQMDVNHYLKGLCPLGMQY